jgi:predicted CXXCH cytochrome family protein
MFEGGSIMKLKTKLLYLAAFLVIGLPFVLTGNTGAGYLWDGAVQDPVTGGWITPNDMVCIVGVKPNGDLDIADNVTNSRDCIYLNVGTMNGGTPFDLRGMTTSDQCTKATGTSPNDGKRHSFATSICVDGSGIGIDLTDLDRNFSMCVAKGGTWKQTSATPPYPGAPGTFPTPGFTGACVAYGRQFKGIDDNGTNLSFGTKGTSDADGGFCYASMNMTSAFPTEAACPVDRNGTPKAGLTAADAYDYSWPTTGATANKCLYAKGIKGYPATALTKADGTTYGTGSNKDLGVYKTMGECLANGGSWNNWVGQPASTAPVATTISSTIPVWDFTRQAPETTNGCLHCHSTLTQYNGPAERFKDSYLNHGHKNMLRKVTAGKKWKGPNVDGILEFYTSAATGPIDFDTAKAEIGGVPKDLLYIFGDWLSPAPEGLNVIVNMGGFAKHNGTSDYTCAACHTTGWSDSSAGLPGVMGIGTPGFTPAEPLASFPTVTFNGTGKWDRDGVQCPRCHNATAPKVVAKQIETSAYPSTHATAGGMGSLAEGVGRTNLCFGCHQNIAKKNFGLDPDADTSHPENLQVKNTASGGYVPEFEGDGVMGNQFLNSPHARFTGNIVPNSLGKYDLEDTTGNNDGNVSKYKSKFQGSTCWQSPTSTSPAMTWIDTDRKIEEIKTQTKCEELYGVGSWRPELISGVPATQGQCVTCHSVHNSLFVKDQKEFAFRKVCTSCHNKSLARINHLDSPGTPLDVSAPAEACVTCHMPTATSSGTRMHLWRINTKASYRTFPTAKEFGIGAPATKKIANAAADGTYTNAVWVDVDYACGQCHGGSFGPTATQNSAPYFLRSELSGYAKGMHRPEATRVSFTSNISHYTVTLTDTSTDDSIFPDNAITVNWGDGTSSTGNAGDVFSHTYATPKRFQIVYSVTDKNGVRKSKKITVAVTFSITATINPAAPSDAEFILLKQNGNSIIRNGWGTSSYVFSGLTPGTYKVKVRHSSCTFDGDGVTNGNQNPTTVVIGTSDKIVAFTRTP